MAGVDFTPSVMAVWPVNPDVQSSVPVTAFHACS
jgi:hypothetical protein